MSESAPKLQVKAFNLRGTIAALNDHGIFDEVAARVSPAVRAVLLNPPPVSAWVDGRSFIEINSVISELFGDAKLRQIGHDSVNYGAVAIMRPLVDSFLRLFGATPATLFTRMDKFAANSTRGAETTFTSTGARSGVITSRVIGAPDVPRAFFLGTAGGLEIVFEICRVKGTIADPQLRREGNDTVAEMRVSW